MNDSTPVGLPALPDEAVERIEHAVFERIGDESARPAPRGRVRRRRLLTAVGVAAAFAVGVLVAPPLLSAVGGSASSTADGGFSATDGGSPDIGVVTPDLGLSDGAAESAEGTTALPGATQDDGREIVATGNATVRVDDIAKAVTAISALAAESGGYVETTEIGTSMSVDGSSAPAPADPEYGWIGIRVPSDDLTSVIDALGDTGEVLSSAVSQQDVTSAAIDLRARIDATEASVQRLTELMRQSGSVADLIDAEVALTERQAQLESYQQQLAALEDQVELSSLQVQLVRSAAPSSADPAGFGDGLLAGWNGLVVSLNALVVAVGFALPWLAVAAVAVLIIWSVRRTMRARRARRDAPPAS